MRTNIEIDDKLINKAKELSKSKSKKETVEIALRNYITLKERKNLLSLFGKVKWEGNLHEMRKS